MAGLWAQGPVEVVTTPSFREMPAASPKGQDAAGLQQRTLSMGLVVERNATAVTCSLSGEPACRLWKLSLQ